MVSDFRARGATIDMGDIDRRLGPIQRSKLKNPRWRLQRAKSSGDLSNLGKHGRFLALIVDNRQQICPLFWFYSR